MPDFKDRKIQIIAVIIVLVAFSLLYFLVKPILSNKPVAPTNSIDVSMQETTDIPPVDPSEPYDIRILNLSESSFTIFFRTKEPVSAFIRVGQNKVLKWKSLDNRISTEKDKSKFYNHIFQFSDPAAKVESTYQYLIEINDKRYDNNENLYSVNMAPLLSSPPAVTYIETFSSLPSQSNFKDSISIISNYDTSGLQESGYSGDLIKENSAILSLGSLRTIDKTAYSNPQNLKIEVFDGAKHYSTTEFLDFDPDSVYNLVLK